MSAIGRCGGCGGELGPGTVRFALEAGPGTRGGSHTSTVTTRLERFDVCGACLAGEEAATTVLSKMLADEYAESLWEGELAGPDRCTVTCLRPRHKSRLILHRRHPDDFQNAYCPVCFGRADVMAAPNARPVKVRLRDRIRNRVPLRETWEDPDGDVE